MRKAEGRDPEPSAAIIDSRSVRGSAEGVVPAATSGYDGSKKVNGRKRHLLADTAGLLITVAVTPANVPDRLGAAILLRRARRRARRRLALAWGDRGYEGEEWEAWAQRETGITIEVVRRDPRGAGSTFKVLPRRWVVERTNAWISRRRRCARDYERLPAHHAAWVQIAAIIQMTRRLARAQAASAAA